MWGQDERNHCRYINDVAGIRILGMHKNVKTILYNRHGATVTVSMSNTLD